MAELKNLPEANLLVPDTEILQRKDSPGTTFKGPNNTSISLEARTHSGAEDVYEFFRSQLSARGWVGGEKALVPGDYLIVTRWRSGDFGFHLNILDKTKVRDASAWEGWTTVYDVVIVAEGKKNE